MSLSGVWQCPLKEIFSVIRGRRCGKNMCLVFNFFFFVKLRKSRQHDLFSSRSLWNLLSKNENVFPEIHSQMNYKTSNQAAGVLRTAYSQSALSSPSTRESFPVAAQFSYPAVGNKQMVRWENRRRGPFLATWEPSWTHVFKGRKHCRESIDYTAGEKETLVSHVLPCMLLFWTN